MSASKSIVNNEMKLRRTGKDSVFCDLFSQPDYLLELYRSLHPEDNVVVSDDLEIVSIEHVITDGEYNDLGFMVADKLVVLVESQTSWSANIVTRMLLYLAETYRRRLRNRGESLHAASVVALPAPELYVVYTGRKSVPPVLTFRNDILRGCESALDLSVRVLRGESGGVIGQYVAFAGVFDEVRQDDAVLPGDKAAEVVDRCVARGILVPYLERRRQEVEDIMFTLFDQEYETELYHKRLAKEIEEQVTKEVTERVTEEVTERVTEEVTERVTEEVTERVTEEVTERVTGQAIQRGIERGKIVMLAQLVEDGTFTVEEAAEKLGISQKRFVELAQDNE